ncbi:helix-turn-helix transcriptional regulator, partial [Salmonella enterica subsp. enterica serovar Typhimurium]|nr:helix-turn-helix transcriptional regulator [Salmonella enterica subsp. enterica serovar Typhimurium]
MYQSVDILVTDLQSAEENPHEGLDILLRLGAQFPELNVVVYTFCHDSNELRKLLNQHNFSVIARGESMTDTEDFFKRAFVQKRILSPKICS